MVARAEICGMFDRILSDYYYRQLEIMAVHFLHVAPQIFGLVNNEALLQLVTKSFERARGQRSRDLLDWIWPNCPNF